MLVAPLNVKGAGGNVVPDDVDLQEIARGKILQWRLLTLTVIRAGDKFNRARPHGEVFVDCRRSRVGTRW